MQGAPDTRKTADDLSASAAAGKTRLGDTPAVETTYDIPGYVIRGSTLSMDP